MSTIQTFDFSVNILRALLWRNNEAPNIQDLMTFKQAYFDENSLDFWTDWVVDVFDLCSANEFGVNVWSIILGLRITIEPTQTPNNSNWGFGEFRKNFNFGNFPPSEFTLNLEDARKVLRLRYYQLTTNGNVTHLNFMLNNIFGDEGNSFVIDNLDMTIVYEFDFVLSSALQTYFGANDILPRPAGVSATFTSL